MPTRRKEPGKRVGRLGLTTSNSLSVVPNDRSQWVWPDIWFPPGVRKEIFASVVEQVVKVFCETQTYSWRGNRVTYRPMGDILNS